MAMNPQSFDIIADFPADEILQWIDLRRKGLSEEGEKRCDFQYNEQIYPIKVISQRYGAFIQSKKCVICGCEGTIMRLEVQKNNKCARPHFNLYGYRRGQLMMLTADHIKAKAVGGENSSYNLQTMCYECNQLKDLQNYPPHIILAEYPASKILSRKEDDNIFIAEGREYTVNLKTVKLSAFRKTCKCNRCGRTGTLMRLEQQIDRVTGEKIGQPYFSLYGKRKKQWILMIHNLIIPKSSGGKDELNNTQVLCYFCRQQRNSGLRAMINSIASLHETYEAIREYPAEEIINWLEQNFQDVRGVPGSNKMQCLFQSGDESYPINVRSKRYRVFCKNRKCVICGSEGVIIRLEKQRNNSQGRYVFNLYSIQNGKLVMMTIDHKKPRSVGGTNAYSNLQTMCYKCNQLKANIST